MIIDNSNIKTALVLGGGGARGAYEIGVWQALREMGIPIDLVTGTSVGAINGALIAQDSFDLAVNLWKELETSTIFDVEIKNIISNQGLNTSKLKDFLGRYIDEKSVRSSQIDFGVVTVELKSMATRFVMKNQIPEGQLLDYIMASASLFPAMKSYEIGNEKFIDGGYSDNLPVGLALDNGATHVIAVDLEAIGIINKKRFKDADFLRVIQCSWDLGNILIFNQNNSKKIMRLGYLDTLKSFEFYDGSYFCFAKGEFEKRSIDGADYAGYIFNLNPEYIYKKYTYNLYLKESIMAHLKEMEAENLSFQSKRKSLLLEAFIKAKSTFNQKTVTISLARFLKEKADDELVKLLFSKNVNLIFKAELSAAKYIIKEGLL